MQLHDRVRKQLKELGELPEGWEGDAIVLAECVATCCCAADRAHMRYYQGIGSVRDHELFVTYGDKAGWYRRKLHRVLKMMSRSRGKQ